MEQSVNTCEVLEMEAFEKAEVYLKSLFEHMAEHLPVHGLQHLSGSQKTGDYRNSNISLLARTGAGGSARSRFLRYVPKKRKKTT